VAAARQAVADLTGGVAAGVAFGPSATEWAYRISGTLSRDWRPGDEVIVSRLDHDSNIRPWIQAAERVGALVRWAEPDLATGELPVAQYEELIGPRTRVVAVTAASNAIGARPDVAAISALAHAAGALAYVDGVHATPHFPVDVAALGADFYTTSAYKWSGPHVGALVADPALLATLRPDKLAPSPDEVPDRFELGTMPFADLAGVTAAVDHIAGLAGVADPGASRRERVLSSMAAVAQYEAALFAHLLGGLGSMSHVTLHGMPDAIGRGPAGVPRESTAPGMPRGVAGGAPPGDDCKAALRAPTAFFSVAGVTPRGVAESLALRGINVWSGNNYAVELCRALGLGPGGAVRAGLVHYNDDTDVDRLLAAMADLA
jgi:cysteine desulfurase family protein (TIGR01976 family)